MARQQAGLRHKGASASSLAVFQQQQAQMPQLGHNQLLDDIFRVPEELAATFPHSKRVGTYLIGKALGEGAFAKVKLGLHVTSGMYVAVKIISKESIKNDAYMSKHYRREPKLLQLFVHPNIVQLFEVLETDNSLYLIMELCDGGDVVQKLKQSSRPLSESEVRRLMRQLLSAVEYVHRLGVLHRDLKAENFLLGADSTLKITDFGLSTMFRKQVTAISPEGQSTVKYKEFAHQTQCGSPAYASPEVLSQQAYCQPADVWSLGINMFYMLHGKLPFMVEPFSMHALLRKVRSYDIEPLRSDLTHTCCDLLRRLLCLNDRERMTIIEAMSHPWITHNLETGEIEPLDTYKVNKAAIVQGINRTVLKYVCAKAQRAKCMSPVEVIQIISSNTPHELNALYHLLLKKLNEYCEAHSLTMEEFEAHTEVKQNALSSVLANKQAMEYSGRNGSLYQAAAVNNRQLRRPQANKQTLLKNSVSQQLPRPAVTTPPSPFTQQWKPQTSRDVAPANEISARPNGSNPTQREQPVYMNLNSTAVGNVTESHGNGPGNSQTLQTSRNDLVTLHPFPYAATLRTSPSLPDVHHIYSSPSTPNTLRRAGKSTREENGNKHMRRMSTASGIIGAKSEAPKQYYQRLSLSSNRVDMLGVSLNLSTQRTIAPTATIGANHNHTRTPPGVSQTRNLHFASRLTPDFNI